MKTAGFVNTIHLIISVLIIVPAAFVYGFNSELLFDIHLQTTDEHNAFKAIMGLYLGFSIIWVLGILKKRFLIAAILSNSAFMLGLGLGRVLSIAMDGLPSDIYIYGMIGEFLLGIYGLWVLKRLQKQPTSLKTS